MEVCNQCHLLKLKTAPPACVGIRRNAVSMFLCGILDGIFLNKRM